MAVTGVRHDQRLHGDGVLFHQVAMQGLELIASLMLPVLADHAYMVTFRSMNFCQTRPVRIVDRHPDAGVGVHHLFGSDDFNLRG